VLSPETVFNYPGGVAPQDEPADVELATDEASVELWLKTRVTGAPLATYGATPATKARTQSRELYLDDTGRLVFAIRPDADLPEPLTVRTDRSVADGRWHHVVAVHAETKVQLYLDGKLVSASRTSPAVTRPGQWWPTDGTPSDPMAKDGMTVELSAVDRPLTGAEVKQRYQAGHR
jgi:hypothetical protein